KNQTRHPQTKKEEGSKKKKNQKGPPFNIPPRPAYSWIAHMTVAHGHLKQVGVQLPLLEYLLRTLPKSKQSEYWQECGDGQQYGRKPMIIGSCTEPVMHT